MFAADSGLAACVALSAFIVYLRTLMPDVGGPEDTAKFQYVGAVLGTAHPPGYPLHTLLSHAFSYLPFGTIAYRANLLSAALGAAAVFAAVLTARATGSSRLGSTFGALVLAFGAAFWNYCVLAEVYTLGAVLLLLVIYWLVRWRHSGLDRHLFAAAASLALGLGNHLSIAAIVLAILLFLLATSWRRVLRPRTCLPAAIIVCSGFLQYLYVLQRTRSGAAYREASASTLAELVDVIRATRFQELMFAFGWRELLTTRLPQAGELVRAEVGAFGVALALVGVVVLFRRDWRTAALVSLAFASLVAFVLNVAGDLRGFLVVPLALLPVAIAAGADAVRAVARSIGGFRLSMAVAIALLIYPASLVHANYSTNDWRRRTGDARFFRALFAQLPPRAALLTEDYIADSIVTYMQAAEGGSRTRVLLQPPGDPQIVRQLIPSGTPVFALDARHSELAPRGFNFERLQLFRPAQLARLHPEEVPRRSAYRLLGTFPTIGFGDAGWHDITAVVLDGSVSILVDNRQPFDARVVIYAAGTQPLRPTLDARRRYGQGDPSMVVHNVDIGEPGHRTALQALLAADKIPEALLSAGDRYVTRIEHVVNDNGQYAAWALSFHGAARRVFASGRPDRPHVLRALATAVPPERLFARHSTEDIPLGEGGERRFGAGWHGVERGSEGEFRWTAAAEAWLWLPSEIPGPVTLAVSAFGQAGATLQAVVNGRTLEPCSLERGSAHCTWTLPASDFKVGGNAVALRSSHLTRPADTHPSADDRLLGVAVTRIQLRR